MENETVKDMSKMRFKSLVRASYIAISSDIFLIVLKFALVFLTGSIIFKADALHSGSDLAVSFTVLFSIIVKYRLSTKPIAREAEAIVSMLIGVLLLLAGLSIITDGIYTKTDAFIVKKNISLIIAFIGISLSCLITLLIARFKSEIGKKHNSLAFTAEGVHTFSDFASSFGVWLTLLFGYFGVHIERIMIVVIGLFIVQLSIRLIIRVLSISNFKTYLKSGINNKMPQKILDRIKKLLNIRVSFFVKLWAKLKLYKFPALNVEFFISHIKQLIGVNIILIFALYLGLGFYTVLPYQTGVEYLFGKVVKQSLPGLHYHLPYPFAKVIKVDTEIAARVECGFRTNWNDNIEEPDAYLWEFSHTDGRFVKIINEALAITGDENVIDANFLCYFRISNPVLFAVDSKNTIEILRAALTKEIHSVLGKYQIESLLTLQRGDVQEELKANMKKIVKELKIGVTITNVYMQEVHPPIDVVPDYRAVASAREKKNEIIHKANGYANDLIPRSRGRGQKKILEAQTYEVEKLSIADGFAKSFLLKEETFKNSANLQKVRLKWNLIESLFMGKNIYILPSKARKRLYLSNGLPMKSGNQPNVDKIVSGKNTINYDEDD